MSTASADDGEKPDHVKKGKKDPRLNTKIKMATWNVRSMGIGKLRMITSEAQIYGISVLGIAEHRWAGQGHFRVAAGGTIIFSGGKKGGLYGVTVYLDSEAEKMLLGYNPVNEWIMTIRLNGKQRNMLLFKYMHLLSQADEEEIEKFYAKLQRMIDAINNRDILIIMGDFNAKLGKGSTTSKLIGPYVLRERNVRGDRLEEFIIENDLAVTSTFFQQPKRRLYTWTTPNGEHRNQIPWDAINNAEAQNGKNEKSAKSSML